MAADAAVTNATIVGFSKSAPRCGPGSCDSRTVLKAGSCRSASGRHVIRDTITGALEPSETLLDGNVEKEGTERDMNAKQFAPCRRVESADALPKGRAFECALGIVCGKWKGMILFLLLAHPLRYSELRSVLLGISERTLAKQLRELCDLGLIVREADANRAQVARYRLSAQGEALGPALRAMESWGLKLLRHPARVLDRVSPQEAIVARRRTGRFPDASLGE